MELIQNTLNSYLMGSQKMGINQIIAEYMLTHWKELPEKKLSDVAKACSVSTPSVIRFCREIGFEDYTDFKRQIVEQKEVHMSIGGLNAELDVSGSEEGYTASVKEWGKRVNRQITNTLLTLDRGQMELLVSDILKYRYVYLFGMSLSTIFTEYLRIQLIFRDKSINTRSVPKFENRLTSDKNQTMAMVVSQHGRFIASTPELFPYLRENCDKIWLITQEMPSTYYRKQADHTLFVPGAENRSVELQGMLSVAELLAVMVKEKHEEE